MTDAGSEIDRDGDEDTTSPAGAGGPVADSGAARPGVADVIERYALLLALLGVLVTFSLLPATSDTFLSTANFKFVLNNQAVPVLVALAVMVPLICNEFDLSVGTLAALSSVIAAAGMTRFGLGWGPAVLLAIGVAALVGLFTGLLRRSRWHQFAGGDVGCVERHRRPAVLVHER